MAQPAKRNTAPFLLVAAGLCFIAAALILVLVVPANESEAAGPARVGQPVADLRLNDLNQQIRTLADYQGKVILVNVWATWCPPCRAEMPDLQAYYTANREKGLVVLAVNAGDARQDVRDFAAEYRLGFPVLLDTDMSWTRRMAIYDYPTSILIGRDGLVKKVHVGKYTTTTLQAEVDPLLSR
jgi:thiol-disulfide isomerase/thioredoxin